MPLSYSRDPQALLGTLEHELIEVINSHIRDYEVLPEDVADTLACMAFACLGHLSWFPGNVRAARASLNEAINHMRRS